MWITIMIVIRIRLQIICYQANLISSPWYAVVNSLNPFHGWDDFFTLIILNKNSNFSPLHYFQTSHNFQTWHYF